MRFDVQNQLSVAQAFVASAVSSNSYKKQSAAQDLSIGRRMALLVLPVVAAGAGSSHQLQVIQATDAALTAGVDVLAEVVKLAAELVPGEAIEVPIPQGVMSKQYIGFKDIITGGVTTVTLDVYLVPQDEIAMYKSFPKVVDADV